MSSAALYSKPHPLKGLHIDLTETVKHQLAAKGDHLKVDYNSGNAFTFAKA